MEGVVLAHQYKIIRGNASPETSITAASFPASGSFINVGGYKHVHCLIELGAIATSDTPTFTIQAATAANGTLATVDSTNLVHTAADDDDNEFILFSFPTSKLATDSHFVTVTASGTLAGTKASIIWLLEPHEKPATQAAAFPAASIHYTV